MKEKNKVILISTDNKYKLLIDNVEVKGVKLLKLEKTPNDLSEITITFKCHLETKEQH